MPLASGGGVDGAVAPVPIAPNCSVRAIAESDPPVIPHVVWQTGPAEQRDGVAALAARNRRFLPPGTRFEFVPDTDVDESMRSLSRVLADEGVVEGAYEAYMDLVPFAFRIDVWRAAVVWVHGGYYLDHKTALKAPHSSWADVERGRLSICGCKHEAALNNPFFAAAPRSPALAAVLKRQVAQIKLRFMGWPGHLPPELRPKIKERVRWPWLAITSPLAYGWATIGMDVHVPCTRFVFNECPDVFVANEDNKLHHSGRSCPTCNNYNELYRRSKVYCSQLTEHDRTAIVHRCRF